jgi:hypothetical protein
MPKRVIRLSYFAQGELEGIGPSRVSQIACLVGRDAGLQREVLMLLRDRPTPA